MKETDVISIQWPNVSRKTLQAVPWWVGCRSMSRGGVAIYWNPVEEFITHELDHHVDFETWQLASTGVDNISIFLSREGMPFTRTGWGGIHDGAVLFDLAVPDEICESRNLDQVIGYLRAECINALSQIGSRLGIGAVVLKSTDGPKKLGSEEPMKSDRVASIADEWTGPGPLLVLSPQFAHRPAASEFAEAFEEVSLDSLSDWRVFSVDHPVSERLEDRLSNDVSDFRGISAPAYLTVLISDHQNMLFLIDHDKGNAAAESPELFTNYICSHFGAHVRVLGNDSGYMWAALGMRRNVPTSTATFVEELVTE